MVHCGESELMLLSNVLIDRCLESRRLLLAWVRSLKFWCEEKIKKPREAAFLLGANGDFVGDSLEFHNLKPYFLLTQITAFPPL